MKALPQKDLFVLYNTAALCARLGKFGRAFSLLNQICDERFPPIVSIKVNPLFDNLRSDPRFGELARRIGLP